MGLTLSSTNSAKSESHLNRMRHPLIIGSAALSLITSSGAVGPICSAFAASPISTARRSQLYNLRGGIRRNMSTEKNIYPRAPPLATVNPFSRVVKKVMIVGGTHGNEYTVSCNAG